MTTRISTDRQRELWLSVGSYTDLLLTGDTVDIITGAQFTIEALADDFTTGAPQPIDNAVERWMTDGAVTATQGHGDRTLSFKVVISADTSTELAAGEAAIVLRSAQVGTLKWISPEGAPDAPASVFEMWTMHLEHNYDDIDEFEISRTYTVTITAKPWVRSDTLTMAAAVPTDSSPIITSVDPCTSATAWNGNPTAPVVIGGTKIRESVAYTKSGITQALTLTRTGSVTVASTPYLMLKMSTSGGLVVSDYRVFADGTSLTKAAQIGDVLFWAIPATVTSFTTLQVTITLRSYIGSGHFIMDIEDVSRTDTIGGIGSHKQRTRRLEVGGSVKTSGSLQVASPTDTDPLGTVLLYTSPDNGSGFAGALRAYRTGGPTVVPDSAAVSGSHDPFITASSFVIPVTSYTLPGGILPAASYVAVVRMFSTTATTITVNVVAGLQGYPTVARASGTVTWAAANTWAWGVIGILDLPAGRIPVQSILPTTIVIGGTGTGTVTLDELYLIDTTHGDMTLLDCGGSTRLWADAPDADPIDNLPALYVGSLADRSDAATVPYSQIMHVGKHDLDPNGVTLFSVTDKVNDASVSASFYHRWHSNAGD